MLDQDGQTFPHAAKSGVEMVGIHILVLETLGPSARACDRSIKEKLDSPQFSPSKKYLGIA